MNANRFRPSLEALDHRDLPSASLAAGSMPEATDHVRAGTITHGTANLVSFDTTSPQTPAPGTASLVRFNSSSPG